MLSAPGHVSVSKQGIQSPLYDECPYSFFADVSNIDVDAGSVRHMEYFEWVAGCAWADGWRSESPARRGGTRLIGSPPSAV